MPEVIDYTDRTDELPEITETSAPYVYLGEPDIVDGSRITHSSADDAFIDVTDAYDHTAWAYRGCECDWTDAAEWARELAAKALRFAAEAEKHAAAGTSQN